MHRHPHLLPRCQHEAAHLRSDRWKCPSEQQTKGLHPFWKGRERLCRGSGGLDLRCIRAEWKIYCIRSAYYIYKNYGSDIYQEALKIIVEAWWGDSDSFLSGILHGVTRFVAMYRDEYSRERLIARLSTVHPKTITKNARKDTGNTADRHMKQILEIYNGSSRSLSLPVKR